MKCACWLVVFQVIKGTSTQPLLRMIYEKQSKHIYWVKVYIFKVSRYEYMQGITLEIPKHNIIFSVKSSSGPLQLSDMLVIYVMFF